MEYYMQITGLEHDDDIAIERENPILERYKELYYKLKAVDEKEPLHVVGS